ncbi:MAG: DUF2207 domain-containing protein [Alphaproteobacteria bacterium]|nr:DUF2207 domain-containing protein [Alphaproteobacteria bacterium]
MNKILRLLAYLTVLFTASFATNAHAEERILLFHSDIKVLADSSMLVTETIQVRAEGNKIKRGIFRDFPTKYKAKDGRRVNVGFKVLEVLKDGTPEPYHIKSISNGKSVYFGDKNTYLDHGVYTYTLKYKTTRQLGYFDDFDELYFNITGNAWNFPIDKTKAIITLPNGANAIEYDAYTGLQGEQGKDFTATDFDDARIGFQTTRPLQISEGITIAVAWPKGFIKVPTNGDETINTLRDNLDIAIPLIAIVLLLAFYIISWHMVGRDPETGAIVPLFEPPEGISPAACRYIMQMGDIDNKTHATAMINMAVKGYWKIIQEKKLLGKIYKLSYSPNDKQKDLSTGEFALSQMIGRTNNSKTFKLEQKNWRKIQNALEDFSDALKREFDKIYFSTNGKFTLVGPLLIAGCIILSFINIAGATYDNGFEFFTTLLGPIVSGSIAFGFTRYFVKRLAGLSSIQNFASKIFSIRFIIKHIVYFIFIAIAIGGINNMAPGGIELSKIQISDFAIFKNILFAVLFGLQGIFGFLIKAPTMLGSKVMDEIKGFRMFLGLVEKERLNLMNPPEKTPELFEKYLPYALALNVENEWSEQFTEVFANIGIAEGNGYSPRWYNSDNRSSFSPNTFASSIGDGLASATSSSSSPPGSSSGSGGGGSSGGGGGGGGGGGW